MVNPRGSTKRVTLADAEKLLLAEEKEALVRMLIDWANDDHQLHERLVLYAARRSGPEKAAAAARRMFENAVRVRDFIDYREASDWADRVHGAIGSMEQLLNDGHAAAAIEVCELGLRDLPDAIQSVDDSDGHFAGLRDRLEEIHYRACQAARPDPVALVKRLFRSELHADLDVFDGAAERYAEILGTEGMRVYRELAEAEWAKLPAQTAGREDSDWSEHFRITRIMESLARASGDIEQLVAVMRRDLASPYQYFRIAKAYRDAHQMDNALLWAEKGLAAFPNRPDPRLRDFAAAEYHRRKRHGDAMQLMWAAFRQQPYLQSYQTLEEHARKAHAWPEWRARALAEIRRSIAGGKTMRVDRSTLVEIFLYEHNPDDAWREACEGGCGNGLWLQLAAAREDQHPADAVPIYLNQAGAGIARGGGDYADSVRLLVKAAAAMRRMDRGAEFVLHLEALRAKYKIKRNFIKLVEQKRKSLYLA
jgi:uncharacterized protein DUF6880